MKIREKMPNITHDTHLLITANKFHFSILKTIQLPEVDNALSGQYGNTVQFLIEKGIKREAIKKFKSIVYRTTGYPTRTDFQMIIDCIKVEESEKIRQLMLPWIYERPAPKSKKQIQHILGQAVFEKAELLKITPDEILEKLWTME